MAPSRSLAWLVDFDADVATTAPNAISALGPAGLYNCAEFGSLAETTLATTRYRFASVPFVTGSGDSPATTPIEARCGPTRIQQQLEIGRDGYYTPMAISTAGELALRNDDGALDALGLGPVLEGRTIRVSVAGIAQDASGRDIPPKLSDFSQLFAGQIASVTWTRDQMRLAIADERLQLGRAVQDVSYNGGGGINGQVDLAGVTKPLAYGRCLNVAPALIDPYLRIFQFHDGETRGVDAVYDSGVPLTLHSIVSSYDALVAVPVVDPSIAAAGDFTVGMYVACPAEGCFRLGGLTAGRVTADVRGHGSNDGAFIYFSDGTKFTDGTGWKVEGGLVHAHTAPQVAVTILRRAGIRNINERQFKQLDADEPREVGLYLPPGGSTTVSDCLSSLLAGNGCFLWRAGDGVYQLRRLAPPANPSLEIGPESILARALSVVPTPWRQPWSRWRVQYARNWTPMSDDELPEAVEPERRTFFLRSAAQAEDVDEATVVVHPARSPAVVDTALVEEADARAQAGRLASVYARGRRMLRFTAAGVGFRAFLGETVRVRYDRFGLATGLNGIIVAVDEDGRSGKTELTVLG